MYITTNRLILSEIFSYTDLKTLLNATSVSKLWREISDDSVKWEVFRSCLTGIGEAFVNPKLSFRKRFLAQKSYEVKFLNRDLDLFAGLRFRFISIGQHVNPLVRNRKDPIPVCHLKNSDTTLTCKLRNGWDSVIERFHHITGDSETLLELKNNGFLYHFKQCGDYLLLIPKINENPHVQCLSLKEKNTKLKKLPVHEGHYVYLKWAVSDQESIYYPSYCRNLDGDRVKRLYIWKYNFQAGLQQNLVCVESQTLIKLSIGQDQSLLCYFYENDQVILRKYSTDTGEQLMEYPPVELPFVPCPWIFSGARIFTKGDQTKALELTHLEKPALSTRYKIDLKQVIDKEVLNDRYIAFLVKSSKDVYKVKVLDLYSKVIKYSKSFFPITSIGHEGLMSGSFSKLKHGILNLRQAKVTFVVHECFIRLGEPIQEYIQYLVYQI